MSKRLFTPAEAIKLLSISRKTLARWIEAGKIEAVESPSDDPRGRRYKIPRRELKRLGVEFEENGKAAE